MQKTPPNGPEFAAVLRRMLVREANWNNWKVASCPKFERSSVTVPPLNGSETEGGNEDGGPDVDTLQSVLGKRSHSNGSSSAGASTGAKRARAGSRAVLPVPAYYVGHSDPEIQTSAKKLVENVPSYEAHLQQYVEAEDPDNGIEDEYHPKVLLGIVAVAIAFLSLLLLLSLLQLLLLLLLLLLL